VVRFLGEVVGHLGRIGRLLVPPLTGEDFGEFGPSKTEPGIQPDGMLEGSDLFFVLKSPCLVEEFQRFGAVCGGMLEERSPCA